ncbi:trypsin-like peptidase domain-containing protein [Leptolyngbya sp. FACHB-711]|uniref:S1C family serine protease n=1 Tax=Leptolyngbya sp. FACHB-711 TaxID=2692813 RepID=UPI001682191D|nr:trypsin-like peptidase domain-containing protein [Leptolyngbya sp. FACHB-711]MBD1850001.1 trypsin-like peptidase domain-containing protein [Cyanobacteria bacterium FACHB-502]MBD2027496.1 trypsin-like peptidase domain-containing protein [Leptolyngbya sp. FACHB-711]
MNSFFNLERAAEFDTQLTDVIQRLQQSTVQLQSGRGSMGSGVIWNADGLILTNAHVVRGRAIIALIGNRQLEARVIRKDESLDLAALVVNARNLPEATIAPSLNLRVGEMVIAVGNPAGLHNAVNLGIIHTVAPPQSASPWIQADVRLAPGYSGGPLATLAGQVLGINSMIVDGRAFAISTEAIDRFLASQSEQPRLGAMLQPVVLAQGRKPIRGWVITDLTPNSPAAGQLLIGDVVLGINDRPFLQHRDLADWLKLAKPGDRWQVTVLRGDRQLQRNLILDRKTEGREAA